MFKKNYVFLYFCIGFILGILFPLFSVIMEINRFKLNMTWANIILIHSKSPLLWVIDSAPIFLAFFSSLAGLHGSRLRESKENLRQINLKLQHEIRERLVIENNLKSTNLDIEKLNIRLEEDKRILQELSVTDSLTKLFNRRYIFNQLKSMENIAKRYKNTFSLIILDIDDFKLINDQYGHPKGDEVLQKLSEIITANIRSCDIAARYGGEEFMILLPESSVNAAFDVAERVRLSVEKYEWLDINKITISVGVSQFSDSIDKLFIETDELLYQAKNSGKNQVRKKDLA